MSRLFYSAVSRQALRLNKNVVFHVAVGLLGFNLSLEHVFSFGLWVCSDYLFIFRPFNLAPICLLSAKYLTFFSYVYSHLQIDLLTLVITYLSEY
jgi:uncharacterized membrane protein YadS